MQQLLFEDSGIKGSADVDAAAQTYEFAMNQIQRKRNRLM